MSASGGSAPNLDPHNRGSRRRQDPEDPEDLEDPVDRVMRKAGCAEAHYAVQECMVDHKDWRKCQDKVKAFKDCIDQNKGQRI